MHIVIGTGQPRDLDFSIVNGRTAVPPGAIVFATCDGDRLVSHLDEHLFAAITDEEYDTYMALLRDAREREQQRLHERRATTVVRRFVNWLSGIVAGESAAIHQSGSQTDGAPRSGLLSVPGAVATGFRKRF